jgi:hypothetical protein
MNYVKFLFKILLEQVKVTTTTKKSHWEKKLNSFFFCLLKQLILQTKNLGATTFTNILTNHMKDHAQCSGMSGALVHFIKITVFRQAFTRRGGVDKLLKVYEQSSKLGPRYRLLTNPDGTHIVADGGAHLESGKCLFVWLLALVVLCVDDDVIVVVVAASSGTNLEPAKSASTIVAKRELKNGTHIISKSFCNKHITDCAELLCDSIASSSPVAERRAQIDQLIQVCTSLSTQNTNNHRFFFFFEK